MKKKLSKIESKYKCNYDLIIRLYSMNKIYLAPWEVSKYLKKRGEKKYPHYELRKGRVILV